MLLAELHGKGLAEAKQHEDSLTSVVFGHLRYVAPGEFWTRLFARAIDVGGQSLRSALDSRGVDVERYSTLDVRFWPTWADHGEPDLMLCFLGGDQRPLVIVIEAKLWAGKSGVGDRDQLVRYLRILDDPAGPNLPHPNHGFLIYLTPHDSEDDLRESIEAAGAHGAAEKLFQAQWQDVADAAWGTSEASGSSDLILKDVAQFLRKRGFERFKGFGEVAGLECIEVRPACFIPSLRALTFAGFSMLAGLEEIDVQKGAWTHGE